jgi:hypothetical protein
VGGFLPKIIRDFIGDFMRDFKRIDGKCLGKDCRISFLVPNYVHLLFVENYAKEILVEK